MGVRHRCGMSAPRRFDHDEARRRRRAGETYAAIARDMGVTPVAVARVCDQRLALAMAMTNAARLRGTCATCGAHCSFNQAQQTEPRCRACEAAARTTTVRDDALQCVTCREWKWDTEFPWNRAKRSDHRRGRHTSCRACNTVLRRAYREKRKVPCSHGCGHLVLHENGGKPPECHACAMRRISESRVREPEAASATRETGR